MSLRVTDTDNVALYDATTGWAYGPIFANEENAEDFLRYAASKDIDLRHLPWRAAADLHVAWSNERVDPETGYIREDAEELSPE